MERNDVLIDQVMDHIRAHPQEWDQRYWAEVNPCGTTACFAGHAMLLSGYTVEQVKRGCDEELGDDHDCRYHGCETVNTIFFDPEGRPVGLESKEGAKLLGLKEYEADPLFYGTSTTDPDVIQEIIDDIRAGS